MSSTSAGVATLLAISVSAILGCKTSTESDTIVLRPGPGPVRGPADTCAEPASCPDGMVPAKPEDMAVLGRMMTEVATAPEPAPLDCSLSPRPGDLRVAIANGDGSPLSGVTTTTVRIWPLLDEPVARKNIVGTTLQSRRKVDAESGCELTGTTVLHVPLPATGEFEVMAMVFFEDESTAVFQRQELKAGVRTADFRLPDRGRARGRVVDATSKQPIPGATVKVSANVKANGIFGQHLGRIVTCDAQGRFEFAAEGDLSLWVSAPGHDGVLLPQDGKLNVPTGTTKDLGDLALARP